MIVSSVFMQLLHNATSAISRYWLLKILSCIKLNYEMNASNPHSWKCKNNNSTTLLRRFHKCIPIPSNDILPKDTIHGVSPFFHLNHLQLLLLTRNDSFPPSPPPCHQYSQTTRRHDQTLTIPDMLAVQSPPPKGGTTQQLRINNPHAHAFPRPDVRNCQNILGEIGPRSFFDVALNSLEGGC